MEDVTGESFNNQDIVLEHLRTGLAKGIASSQVGQVLHLIC